MLIQSFARVAFGAALVLAAACERGIPARPGTPPDHLLLVTVSGLRADHVSGAYLYLRPTTAWPIDTALRNDGQALALDDLCEQGVAFAWAFAPAPHARDALLALHTGIAPTFGPAPTHSATLAETLTQSGFVARAFVSATGLGDTAELARGFASFEARRSDAETIDAAVQALAALDREKTPHAFFWVHLDGPEPPFEPPVLAQREGEAGGAVDYAARFVDPRYAGTIDGSLATLAKIERGELALTAADRSHLTDLYDGELAATAARVRELATAWRNVDGSGKFFERTLFVFAGASGAELYERARPEPRGGPWIGIEQVRVPLFFRHPPSLTGSRLFAEPVDLTDVAPTIREWFRGPGTEDVRPQNGGRTLLPRFDSYVSRPFESRAIVSVDARRRAAALRTAEWTLLSIATAEPSAPEIRLYDRLHDPREEQDVAALRPEKVAELRPELDRRLGAAPER